MVHGVARWETSCSRQTGPESEVGGVHLTQFLIAEVESAKLGTGRSEDGEKGHREIFEAGEVCNQIHMLAPPTAALICLLFTSEMELTSFWRALFYFYFF